MASEYIQDEGTGVWYPLPGSNSFKADLFPDVSKTSGKPVLRCSGCKKIAYVQEKHANEAADRTGGTVYFDQKCGWWHLKLPPAPKNGVIHKRDYQEAADELFFGYFAQGNVGNPIIAMPTGPGKSIVIAEIIRKTFAMYPQWPSRVMMLTHVKELIEQNFKTLLKVWPTAPAGIYSAGLGRKDTTAPITFAGIQSVYQCAHLFGRIDIVLIDECHLVSPKSETMYAAFINELRKVNPNLRVAGFSATPYRLKHGLLTDSDGLFTDVAMDLTSRESFNWLIAQGWLVPVVPKQAKKELDVTGVKMQGGEFVQHDLQERVDHEEITVAALQEAVVVAESRQHWLVFASGVQHAEHIADYLDSVFQIPAAAVHSKLEPAERDRRIRDFRAGKLRALVNNNILTTGFDYPDIDCIVMLRPTASPGLWVQMLGRGTRPVYPPGMPIDTMEERLAAIAASTKRNCLVLDFAGNTKRLGPINDPVLPRARGKGAPGIAPVRLCEACGCYSHASARFCENVPDCGVEFPRAIKISSQASIQDLISGTIPTIESHPVTKVTYGIHKKEGKPDSMKVTYYSGFRRFTEYVCLDHGGYAARVARRWWEQRSPWGVPPTVADGMAAIDYLRVPSKITVAEKNKYPEICGYEFV